MWYRLMKVQCIAGPCPPASKLVGRMRMVVTIVIATHAKATYPDRYHIFFEPHRYSTIQESTHMRRLRGGEYRLQG